MQLSSDKNIASEEAQVCLERMLNSMSSRPLPFDQALADRMVSEILEEDLPSFMFHNAVMGQVRLLQFVHANRGPIPFDYQSASGKRKARLNGKPIKSKHRQHLFVFGACWTGAHLKAMFEAFRDCGLKGLIEADDGMPYLFQANYSSRGVEAARKAKFNGELPFLSAGVLKSPELLLCLAEESIQSATPEAYLPILCWATEAMVLQYPEMLAPMRPLQRVEYEDQSSPGDAGSDQVKTIRNIQLAQFKFEAKPADQAVVRHIALGFQAGKMTEMAGNLNAYMGGQLPGLGLADAQGRVLCETRVDFLRDFPQADCSARNLSISREFVQEYCPLDIIGLQALRRHKGDRLHPKDTEGHLLKNQLSLPLVTTYQDSLSLRRLFSLLVEGSPVREQMVAIMTREQWIALANSGDTLRFGAEHWLLLRDEYSIGAEGNGLWVTAGDVDALHRGGYKFSKDSKVFDDVDQMISYRSLNPGSTCVCLGLGRTDIFFHLLNDNPDEMVSGAFVIHRQVQAMSLWSCTSPKPASIEEALTAMVGVCPDNPNNTRPFALAAYLLNLGVDACAKAAISLDDWTVITKLFSHTEVAPYLSVMPRLARGRALEQQLGL
jgi:hypothetical protein